MDPHTPPSAAAQPTDAAWSPAALLIYFDSRLAALMELKQHDLDALRGRIVAVETRLVQLIDVSKDHGREVTRRLEERQDTAIAAIRERLDLSWESVDERFRLAKEFNEQTSKAAGESLSIALTASNEAVKKAEQAVEKRFDSVNEFRQSLSDLSAKMILRTEVIVMSEASNDKINTLTSRIDRIQGAEHRSETSTTTIIAIAGVMIALIVGAIGFATFLRTGNDDSARSHLYLSPTLPGR